ncbi:MAG: hypothetical protein V1721_05735 [Pseudomonadota bacterium]
MAWFKKYFIDNEQDFPAGIKLVLKTAGLFSVFILTYCVAPNINEIFEQQKKQSAFYQLYFESFNTDSKDFYGKMTVYVADSDAKIDKEQYNKLRELIARMQLRALELFVILQVDNKAKILVPYQSSLNGFLPYIKEAYAGEIKNKEQLRANVKEFSSRTADLMEMLAREANIIKK